MMKKLLFILLLFISCGAFGQFTNNIGQGSATTQIYSKGGYGADSAFILRNYFSDTTAANRGFLDGIPGCIIRTSGGNVWIRNDNATRWILIGGAGGGSNNNIYNIDGTLTGNREVTLDGSYLYFLRSGQKQLSLETTSTIIGSVNANKRLIFFNDSIKIQNNLVSSSSTDSVLVISPTGVIKSRAQSSIAASTPTWQQTLTTGSTLTGNNTIAAGNFNFTWNNAKNWTYNINSGGVWSIVRDGTNYLQFDPTNNSQFKHSSGFSTFTSIIQNDASGGFYVNTNNSATSGIGGIISSLDDQTYLELQYPSLDASHDGGTTGLLNNYNGSTPAYSLLADSKSGQPFTGIILNKHKGTEIGTGLSVNGENLRGLRVDSSRNVYLDSLTDFVDTINFKQVVINTTGTGGTVDRLYKATYWPLVTASNGLTLSSGDVKLGGTLTGNTTISGATFNLGITGLTDYIVGGTGSGEMSFSGLIILTSSTGAEVRTNLTIGKATFFTGDLIPPQITADQNNYSPTDLGINSILKLSSDASRNITGIAGGTDGATYILMNTGSFDIVLIDESASSTAVNRFALTGNITLVPDKTVMIIYDGTAQRWRAVQ